VTGGVPRYLEEMNPTLSADVNIQRMCFTPEGLLFKEFDLIFHDLFSRRDKVYREIVAATGQRLFGPRGTIRGTRRRQDRKISEYQRGSGAGGIAVARLHLDSRRRMRASTANCA